MTTSRKNGSSGAGLALGAAAALSLLAVARKGARAKAQIRSTGKVQITTDLLDELAKDLEDLEGHYGKAYSRHGNPHFFKFDIKAHGAYAPDWVEYAAKKLKRGESCVWDYQSEYAHDEIENFVYGIKYEREYDSLTAKHTGPPNPDYAEWYTGEHHTAGRSGGYLMLGHNQISEDLDRLSREWGDRVTYLLGGVYLDQDYEKDAIETVEKAQRALESVAKIKKQIAVLISQYVEVIRSDDFWMNVFDLNLKKVEGFKAAMAREKAAGTYRSY